MAGKETAEVAKSAHQLADLSWELSYDLFALSKQMQDAGPEVDLVSREVASTGVALQRLVRELEKDEGASGPVCSAAGIDDLTQTFESLRKLFKTLPDVFDDAIGKKATLGSKEKLTWSLPMPRIEPHQRLLQTLKGSILIILNVVIYAGQVRRHEDPSTLETQRHILAAIQQDRTKDAMLGFQRANLAVNPDSHSKKPAPRESTVSTTRTTAVTKGGKNGNSDSDHGEGRDQPLHAPDQIRHHAILVSKLLEEINTEQNNKIDLDRRFRLHDALLETHYNEWKALCGTQGETHLRSSLESFPSLLSNWTQRTERRWTELENEVDDREFRNEMRNTFHQIGIGFQGIEAILRRLSGDARLDPVVDLSKPTWIRCHTEHLDPRTLGHYGLPWEYDIRDPSYIIIKKWIGEDFQDLLFEHTKNLRDRECIIEERKNTESHDDEGASSKPVLKQEERIEETTRLAEEGESAAYVLRPSKPMGTQEGKEEQHEEQMESDAAVRSSGADDDFIGEQLKTSTDEREHIMHTNQDRSSPGIQTELDIDSLLAEWTNLTPQEIESARHPTAATEEIEQNR